MSSYFEKFKDPRWQKKRLEILNRDGWECKICGEREAQLQVHRTKYHKEPWDASDEDLETLCEICHENITKKLKDIRSALNTIDMLVIERFHMLCGGGEEMENVDPSDIHKLIYILSSSKKAYLKLDPLVQECWRENNGKVN